MLTSSLMSTAINATESSANSQALNTTPLDGLTDYAVALERAADLRDVDPRGFVLALQAAAAVDGCAFDQAQRDVTDYMIQRESLLRLSRALAFGGV